MSDMTPEEERFYATASITVLYDVLADTATRIGGKYVALSRAAASDAEREKWRRLMYEAEDRKEAIDPDDRDAIIAQIRRFQAEIARLRGEQE